MQRIARVCQRQLSYLCRKWQSCNLDLCTILVCTTCTVYVQAYIRQLLTDIGHQHVIMEFSNSFTMLSGTYELVWELTVIFNIVF